MIDLNPIGFGAAGDGAHLNQVPPQLIYIFFTSATSLKEAKAATRSELSRLGYTVYVGGSARRIYVIEYSPSFRADSSDVWLYVGETGKPV